MNLKSVEQCSIWGTVGLICSLFCVNTGRAYFSGRGPAGVTRLADSSVLIKAARPVAIGYADPKGQPINGVSDLNGWISITITPKMVGKTIAVYTSIETKRTKGGRTSPVQQAWIKKVKRAMGIAFVANSAESAKRQIVN